MAGVRARAGGARGMQGNLGCAKTRLPTFSSHCHLLESSRGNLLASVLTQDPHKNIKSHCTVFFHEA